MRGRGRSGPRRVADADGDADAGARPRTRRVFVAIPLPEAARRDVAELVGAVRSSDPDVRDVRWVRLDGLHLTLRFIGQVDDSRVEAIARAMAQAAADLTAFGVTIQGAGAFPSPVRPRTLWLGVTAGSDEAAAAAGRVEDALASVGVERSTRPFRAHLTLARSDGVRSGPDAVRRLIDAAAGRSTSFSATELVLFETIQGGGPARYERLAVVPLSATPREPEPRRRPSSPVLPSEPSEKPRASDGARLKE